MKYLLPILLITLLMFVQCSHEPKRAAGIPNNAFWVGGPDGGNWYVIKSIDREAKTINFKIYNDFTGDLEVDKTFKLHCYYPDKDIKWDDLDEEIKGFDGEYIVLRTRDSDNKSCYFK